MEKGIIALILLGLMIMPFIIADVIIPTVTNVYFEKDGSQYNNQIDFKITGCGYYTGMPGSPSYEPYKEPGTYTPESVFGVSATYNFYGDQIYNNYYKNYRHIDYYELTGTTSDGSEFIIENLSSFVNCSSFPQFSMANGTGYYKYTPEYNECISGKPVPEWGISCGQYIVEILESEMVVDENGHPIENLCEIRFDLDDAEWSGEENTNHPLYPAFSKAHDISINNNNLVVSDNIIYNTGYYSVNGGSWQSFTLQGDSYGGGYPFLLSSGTSNLNLPSSGTHYIIVFSCNLLNNDWDCHGGKWQLHIIDNS